MKSKSFTAIAAGLMCLALIASCGTANSAAKGNTKEALEKRVNTLWQARVEKDWKTVYPLLDAAYRKANTKETFLAEGGMHVLGFKTVSIDKDPENPDSALVKTRFETIKMGVKINPLMAEKWILENGDWFLFKSMSAKQNNPFFKKMTKKK